jgi:hypothetical protein
MLSKLTRVPLVLSLILIAPSGVVVAQSASIAGVVRDGNGGVMPGVTVTTIPQSGGLMRHTTSGSDGSYRFDGLPDGMYRVDFDTRVFELVRHNHVRVSRDREARIDAALPVRAMCECITVEPPSPWAQRLGQVIDKTGHPLPHARVELVGRQVMSTDGEGRFLIRIPVNETWSLTATDTGFQSVTQQVSGADAATVVLSLDYEGTIGVPEVQRFGGCDCPGGYLLPYGGR